jgi:4-hydroxy-3-polyprenylbenzoate decarboxylase
MQRKIIIAITGASGSIYAQTILGKLKKVKSVIEECGIIFSSNALDIWKFELGEEPGEYGDKFKLFDKKDFNAPFASGSAGFDTLIIIPCSMGTLGRIASGVSDDLITRAADVIIKERKKLILVTRETPLSLIHLRNMVKITEAGGIICPANPAYYSKPKTVDEVVETVVNRVLSLAGIDNNGFKWGDK